MKFSKLNLCRSLSTSLLISKFNSTSSRRSFSFPPSAAPAIISRNTRFKKFFSFVREQQAEEASDLLTNANNGASGKAATNNVIKPYCITEKRWKTTEFGDKILINSAVRHAMKSREKQRRDSLISRYSSNKANLPGSCR